MPRSRTWSPPDGFGDELRSRRKAAGLTLTAVAEAVGVSIGYLSSLERGKVGRAPDPVLIQRLAELYRVDSSSLLVAGGLVPALGMELLLWATGGTPLTPYVTEPFGFEERETEDPDQTPGAVFERIVTRFEENARPDRASVAGFFGSEHREFVLDLLLWTVREPGRSEVAAALATLEPSTKDGSDG